MKYGMIESFTHILQESLKVNSGKPYTEKLHVWFLEEFISNCLNINEGGKFTYA